MSGKELHDFLQGVIEKAIASTNEVARGGLGEGRLPGDEILDAKEREQLRQKSTVASEVLRHLFEENYSSAPYQRR